MRIRPSLLAAGSGLTVLLAVGVPAVAYAESGGWVGNQYLVLGDRPGAGARKATATTWPRTRTSRRS